MLQNDDSYGKVNDAVDAVKSKIDLAPDGQGYKYSGHESADYGNGPDRSAANPAGSPGTGGKN